VACSQSYIYSSSVGRFAQITDTAGDTVVEEVAVVDDRAIELSGVILLLVAFYQFVEE
jgi:hypothetical protein